jgi:hypothetical protein
MFEEYAEKKQMITPLAFVASGGPLSWLSYASSTLLFFVPWPLSYQIATSSQLLFNTILHHILWVYTEEKNQLKFFSIKITNLKKCFVGEVNGGYISDSQSLAGSRKSLAMQNVMMVPHMQMAPPPTPGGTLPPPEQYSDGQGGPHQGVPPPYGSYPNMQNFQL